MHKIEETYDEIIRIAGFDFTLLWNPQYNWDIFYNEEKVGKTFDTKQKAKNYLKKYYSPEKIFHVKFL